MSESAALRGRRNSSPSPSRRASKNADTNNNTPHLLSPFNSNSNKKSGMNNHNSAHRPDRRRSISGEAQEFSASTTSAAGKMVKEVWANVATALNSHKESSSSSNNNNGNGNNNFSKSPRGSRKMRKPSQIIADIPFLPGRRSRRGSEDDAPMKIKPFLQGPPNVPLEEVFDPALESTLDSMTSLDSAFSLPPRPRASTIGNGQVARARLLMRRQQVIEKKREKKQQTVPTVFKLSEAKVKNTVFAKNMSMNNGDAANNSNSNNEYKVFVAGTMTNWKCVEMTRPSGEKDFITILDCNEGRVFFKFNINGVWIHDSTQDCVSRPSDSRAWNHIVVAKSDNDVFDALACDSFVMKHKRLNHPSDEDREEADVWGQDKPSISFMESHGKGPPILPPHLLQEILNKKVSEGSADPVLLPEPSHVTLNHLYAQSIRDSVLVVSSTVRFRKKCVTMLYYKTIDL